MVPSASAARRARDVFVAAQRRVDLAGRVVAEDRGVGEEQVVRRDLGRDAQPARLGLAQDAHRAEARDVRDVVASAGHLGEEHVARDDDVFGDARPAAEAEPGGDDRPRASARLR